MKHLLLAITLVLTQNFAHALECDDLGRLISEESLELANDVNKVVTEIPKQVLAIKVNHDGSGAVKVLVNEKNELIGISFNYKNSDDETMFQQRSIDQFNAGEKLKYEMDDGSASPLIVQKSNAISKTTGGQFKFSLMTSKDPKKFLDYLLTLKKENNVWKIAYNNKNVTKTTISPNIEWFSWAGTFSGATFE